MSKGAKYPVIDLFAGPGGLGEGFASCRDHRNRPLFESVLAVERDEFAHRTLRLRHFLRLFRDDEIPESYFSYLAGGIDAEEFFEGHAEKLAEASSSAVRMSLGAEVHDDLKKLVRRKLAGRRRWALVGGPPCQAYSLVGRSRMRNNPDFEKDERHYLYKEYLKIITDHRPPVFVMENVKGLLSANVNGEPVLSKILSDLREPKSAVSGRRSGPGYRLYSLSAEGELSNEEDPRLFLVRAEEYGVPQARHRMFIVGVRSDLNAVPATLAPLSPPSVQETIGNLPAIRSGISRGADDAKRWRAQLKELDIAAIRNELNGFKDAGGITSLLSQTLKGLGDSPADRRATTYAVKANTNHKVLSWLHDSRIHALPDHEARSHMPSDLHRYLFAAAYAQVVGVSPKLSDFPVSLLPEHKNVEEGRSGKMFSDRFRVQLPGRVSTTVTSHISKDGHYFIHYDPVQCRSLTVREAARLQTFPDNYKFEGPRTAQYHQVGNAVPPYLARQIASVIADVLNQMPEDD